MVLLQIYFEVSAEQSEAFERMYAQVYVPALRKQGGYQASNLLRLYPPTVTQQIEGTPSEFNYQIELVFDTEENRRRWAASAEHSTAWPQATALARQAAWRGYDMAGTDEVQAP
jgi:heme-degrading monooxygenase HmoA